MTIPRQEALLVIGLLFLAGFAFTVSRLARARKHGLSIRLQVFLVLAVTTLLLTSVFGVIVVDRFEARAVLFAHSAALDDAKVASAIVSRSMEVLGLSLQAGAESLEATRILYDFRNWGNDTRVQLVDPSGMVLFDSLEATGHGLTLADRPEVKAALSGEIDPVARAIDANRVAAATPISVNGRVVGAARVTKSTLSMKDILSDTAPKVALLGLILAGAAALSGIVIGKSLALPIERLTLAAQTIARGERQASLPTPRGREVRALTSAFESMRTELEERHAVETLAADIFHELKNPVASIQAAAEVLVDAVRDDPETAVQFAGRISQSAARLDALTQNMLSLARLEARGIGEKKGAVVLGDVAHKAMVSSGDDATRREVGIALSAGDHATVAGDAAWLQRAMENLLSNAIAYSPPGATVSVEIEDHGDCAEVLVADSGPGIDSTIAGRVFDRFMTTRQGDGGTGLGLAIVRAVAEAHGGSAEIRSTGNTGTTMAMIVPRK